MSRRGQEHTKLASDRAPIYPDRPSRGIEGGLTKLEHLIVAKPTPDDIKRALHTLRAMGAEDLIPVLGLSLEGEHLC